MIPFETEASIGDRRQDSGAANERLSRESSRDSRSMSFCREKAVVVLQKFGASMVAVLAGTICLGGLAPAQTPYNPLRLRFTPGDVTVIDRSGVDRERGRTIPIRIYVSDAGRVPSPVILFSHGLGGTRGACEYLMRHWAGRGYVVVAMQHPGSDDSVWRDVPLGGRMRAMKEAASVENFRLRVGDVTAVLDRLRRWDAGPADRLHRRLDMTRVGMSGHSFGAHTTQAVGGQSFPWIGRRFVDSRIDAALALSPSRPGRGDPGRTFGGVTIPWMLMTGTHDEAVIGEQTAASRREVYPALPETIAKYELVLNGAEHSAFADGGLSGDRKPRDANHHRSILAISTAFWDGYLRDDAEAIAWLHGKPTAEGEPAAEEKRGAEGDLSADGVGTVRGVLDARDGWRWHVPDSR